MAVKFEEITKEFLAAQDRGKLLELQQTLMEVLAETAEQARQKAREDALALFAAAGVDLATVFPELAAPSFPSEPKRGRKSRGDAAVKPSTDTAKARFRSPIDETLMWSGGRGRVPLWVQDLKSRGVNLADIELDENGNWLDEASAKAVADLLKSSV